MWYGLKENGIIVTVERFNSKPDIFSFALTPNGIYSKNKYEIVDIIPMVKNEKVTVVYTENTEIDKPQTEILKVYSPGMEPPDLIDCEDVKIAEVEFE